MYLISKRVMGSSRSRRFIDKCKWNSGVTRPRAARTDSEKHSNGAGGRIGKAIAKGFRLAVGSSKGTTIADRRTEIKQISQSSHSIDPARRRSSSVWHKRSNDTRDPRAQPTNRRSHQKKQVMPLVRPLVKESKVYNDTPYVFAPQARLRAPASQPTLDLPDQLIRLIIIQEIPIRHLAPQHEFMCGRDVGWGF